MEDPGGKRGVLPAAFVVAPRDVTGDIDAIRIDDAPDGAGAEVVDRTVRLGQTIALYAVSVHERVFERLKELDPLVPAASMTADDLDLDSAFGGFDGDEGGDPSLKNIGQNERTVFQLIAPERDVQKLVDLSRLGEFETCKALERLIDAGFIRPLPQDRPRTPSAEATIGGISARPGARFSGVLSRAIASAAIVAGLAVFVRMSDTRWLELLGTSEPWGYADTSLQSEIALGQIQKIERALAMFEAATGSYPAALDELVQARLLTVRDLRFPWRQLYKYRREGSGYVLLRPFF